MARGNPLIVGGEGIAAGAPFELNKLLIVGNAIDPVAITGRLGQLPDTEQSIVAPDRSGALRTFVMGEEADGRGATDLVLIGRRVKQTGAANQGLRSVYIGGNIDPGAAATSRADNVYIGWDFTFSDAGSSHSPNVVIGSTPILEGTDAGGVVLLGGFARANGGFNVGIGNLAVVGPQSVVIGKSAGNTNAQTVAIGEGTAASARGTAVGWSAQIGTDGVAIGFNAGGSGTDGIAIGRDTGDSGLANTITMGRGTVALEANSFAAGGGPTPITVVRFGPNTLAGYGGLSFFMPSASNGTNIVAPTTTFRGGINTGNAVGGDLLYQLAVSGASGTAYQSLVTALRLVGGTVNLGIFGDGSFGGGSRVIFIANATTVPSSNPTGGGILYVTGGALTYRGSGGTVTTIAPA